MASMDGNAKPLTPKQARFVEEYLKTLNATQAYLFAYPDSSLRAAESSASDLLRNPKVASAIAAAQQKRAKRTEITQDWVLKRLRKEALRRGEGSSHSARVAAIKLAGQHVGLFKDKLELTGKDGAPLLQFFDMGLSDEGDGKTPV